MSDEPILYCIDCGKPYDPSAGESDVCLECGGFLDFEDVLDQDDEE